LGFVFRFWVSVLGFGFGLRFWALVLGFGFGFRFWFSFSVFVFGFCCWASFLGSRARLRCVALRGARLRPPAAVFFSAARAACCAFFALAVRLGGLACGSLPAVPLRPASLRFEGGFFACLAPRARLFARLKT
jgi:hypothetical protein